MYLLILLCHSLSKDLCHLLEKFVCLIYHAIAIGAKVVKTDNPTRPTTD